MSTNILVIGESGSGKSTSIRTLDPKETYVINVLNKALPFKGAALVYRNKEQIDEINKSVKEERKEKSNFLSVKPKIDDALVAYTTVYEKIIGCIAHINKDRPDIKNIVIDDVQYVVTNDFIARDAKEGWGRVSGANKHFWQIITNGDSCREDLNVIFLNHAERDKETGRARSKTLRGFLAEGHFTFVFNGEVLNDKYYFETNGLSNSTAKTPMGMFTERHIPNDLQLVLDKINGFKESEVG